MESIFSLLAVFHTMETAFFRVKMPGMKAVKKIVDKRRMTCGKPTALVDKSTLVIRFNKTRHQFSTAIFALNACPCESFLDVNTIHRAY